MIPLIQNKEQVEQKQNLNPSLFFNAEQLMADEFSAELAEGLAYVAGHDEESRPVVVILSLISLLFSSRCNEIN